MRSARANRTDFLQVISKIKHRTFSIYTLQVCNEKQQITANGSIIIVKVSWWKRNPHRNPGKCYTDQINIVAVRQVLTAPPPPFHPSHPHYCTGQASLPALLQGIPSRPQVIGNSRPQPVLPGSPWPPKSDLKLCFSLSDSPSQAT